MLIGREEARTHATHARNVKSLPTMAECVRLDSSRSSHTMDESITLPPDEIFRNLDNAKRFAIDIGGSLTKLAYYSTVQHKVRSFDHATKASYMPPTWTVTLQEGDVFKIGTRASTVQAYGTTAEAWESPCASCRGGRSCFSCTLCLFSPVGGTIPHV